MARVREIAGDSLTDGELKELANILLAKARDIRNQRYGITADEAVNAALREMSEDVVNNYRLQKRNTYLLNNAWSRELGKIQGSWADDPRKGLEVTMVGSNIARRGAQRSIDADQKSLANDWRNGFEARVERSGKHSLYVKGDLDQDVYRALGEMYKGNSDFAGIDRDARELADIIFDYQETIRTAANNAGAWIRKMADYITHQSHDQFKVRTAARQLRQQRGLRSMLSYDESANFQAWRDFVLPKLNEHETFGSMPSERREGWLRAVWRSIATGEHLSADSTSTSGFVGSGSLANKMSQPRILIFKDADARFEYDTKFGRGGTLYERVGHQLTNAAHSVALMQRFGPNPREVYSRLKKSVRLLTESSVQARMATQWTQDERVLDSYFAEIMGEANRPGVDPVSTALRAARLGHTLSKLGGALISSFADTAVAASEQRYQGASLFEAWGTQLDGIFQGYGKRGQVRADRMQLASELGVAVDLLRSAVWSRFSAEDALPGWAARAQHFFFKANGLMWWTDTLRMANAQAMSHRLATFAARSIPELDVDTQRLLKLFDISSDEWDLMRSRSTTVVEGKEYFTPKGANQLTDVEIAYILKKEGKSATDRAVRERRSEIEAKFRDIFSARSEYAVIAPGPRTRRHMTGASMGIAPGTVGSEVARSISQFKGFPAAIIEKVFGRELYGRAETGKMVDAGRSGMERLAEFLAYSTFIGFLSMYVKAYFNGRRLEMPKTSEETASLLAASFLQGGGAGLYGDFLMGQAKDRYGHSALESFLGPTAGTATDLFKLTRGAARLPFDAYFDRLKTGDGIAGDAFFAFKNNFPMLNLFYTRMALDYMFLYQLQEWAAPGSLKKTEKNFKENLNQTFKLPPSQNFKPSDLSAEDIGSLLNPF